MACSQAPKPPETLTSPWLCLLSSIKSQTVPSTWTHVTILTLQPFSPSSLSFIPSSHLQPDCLILGAVATKTRCSLTFAALLLLLGGPACCLHCIPPACSSRRWVPRRDSAMPKSLLLCPLETICSQGSQMVAALPAAGSSGLLFLLLQWTVGGMLAEQGMGCTARAFLADALLRPLPAPRASPPAGSQASLLHKLLREFEDHFSHTCLRLQKSVLKHLELTLGRKQKPIRDGWGGKSLLVNQRLPLSPQHAAVPAVCKCWELMEWLRSSPFAYVFRRGDLSLLLHLANTARSANCLACSRGTECQHSGRWRCWRQVGKAADTWEASFRVTVLEQLSLHYGGCSCSVVHLCGP